MEDLVMQKVQVSSQFWRGKKVFLTGHTGFKGSWLALWLQSMGANLCGYALAPNTTPSLFDVARVADGMQSIIGDIRDKVLLQTSIQQFQPEIIIHMAAQPLVRYSYQHPIETYEVNVIGTANVLEAARHCPGMKSIVSVTTDKCYENQEWVWGYRENEALGGYDPYSSSKACAEIVTHAYRRSYFQEAGIGLASARAGNVIGGGDWALDRLIPDIIRSCMNHQDVTIRNPHAIRPWQHVLEPLSGYLALAEALYNEPLKYSEAWNFGPEDQDAKPVQWITDYLLKQWGEGLKWQLDQSPQPHEATYLKLDCSKAKTRLGWLPQWTLDKTLAGIVEWYKAFRNNDDMRQVTLRQINEYVN